MFEKYRKASSIWPMTLTDILSLTSHMQPYETAITGQTCAKKLRPYISLPVNLASETNLQLPLQ